MTCYKYLHLSFFYDFDSDCDPFYQRLFYRRLPPKLRRCDGDYGLPGVWGEAGIRTRVSSHLIHRPHTQLESPDTERYESIINQLSNDNFNLILVISEQVDNIFYMTSFWHTVCRNVNKFAMSTHWNFASSLLLGVFEEYNMSCSSCNTEQPRLWTQEYVLDCKRIFITINTSGSWLFKYLCSF